MIIGTGTPRAHHDSLAELLRPSREHVASTLSMFDSSELSLH